MKKVIYTLSFVALCSIAANAQSDKPAKQAQPAKTTTESKDAKPSETTLAPNRADGSATDNASSTDNMPTPKKRMAINEKGVPASKSTAEKPKTEKAANPGQPATPPKK